MLELVLPVSSLTEAERCVTLSAASRYTLRKTVGGGAPGGREITHTHVQKRVHLDTQELTNPNVHVGWDAHINIEIIHS